MKNFLAWGALGLSLLLLPSPALPQALSRVQLSAQNNQYFYSNGQGKITGPIVNSMNGNIISSMGILGDTNAWTGGNTWGGGSTFNGSSTFNGLTTFTGQVNGISFISGWFNPTLSPYTAKCDGVTDDAVALNTFFSAVPANSGVYFPPGKVCVFKSPLTLPLQSHVTLEFNGAQLLYSGASTTGDLVTLGTFVSGCSLSYINLDNLWLNSTTTMTSGDAIKLNSLCTTNITRLVVDPAVGSNSPDTFWNACHLNGGGNVYMIDYHCKGQNISEIDNGSSTNQATDFFHYNGTVANGGGIGLNVAGNCGGCYWDSYDSVNNTTGNVLVDQSQVPVQNRQIRFGPNFASDGTPGYGVKISDTGMPAGYPATVTATGSWLNGATSISVAACPAVSLSNTYLMDNSLVPPRVVAHPSSCVGTTMTVSATTNASAGATDSMQLSSGPGPGRNGSQVNCEGCWISTATGDCLTVDNNISYALILNGSRIKNCGGSGLVINSNLSRIQINGGDISQDVSSSIKNNAAGATVVLQGRPATYGSGQTYGGTANGLTPSVLSGCGGADARIFGDDWDILVNWGSVSEATCVIAFSFAHDNLPQSAIVDPHVDNYSWTSGNSDHSITFTFKSNMTSNQVFGAHLSGYGF